MKRKPSEILTDTSLADHDKELKEAEEAVKKAQEKLEQVRSKDPWNPAPDPKAGL